MGYAECELGLKTLLQTMTTEFPVSAQVVAADSNVLNKGYARAAILWPGEVSVGPNAPVYDRLWDIWLDLFQKFTTESATNANFIALRDAVIRKIDVVPHFNETAAATGIYDSTIVSAGDVVDVNREGGGLIYIAQRFRVTVRQQQTVMT